MKEDVHAVHGGWSKIVAGRRQPQVRLVCHSSRMIWT